MLIEGGAAAVTTSHPLIKVLAEYNQNWAWPGGDAISAIGPSKQPRPPDPIEPLDRDVCASLQLRVDGLAR